MFIQHWKEIVAPLSLFLINLDIQLSVITKKEGEEKKKESTRI